jgi:hypothetical protein
LAYLVGLEGGASGIFLFKKEDEIVLQIVRMSARRVFVALWGFVVKHFGNNSPR